MTCVIELAGFKNLPLYTIVDIGARERDTDTERKAERERYALGVEVQRVSVLSQLSSWRFKGHPILLSATVTLPY